MKPAEEPDDVFAPGVVTSQLERSLDRFRAGIREEHSIRPAIAQQLSKPLGQLGLGGIVEIRPGHVKQMICLILDGFNDAWMAMTRTANGDT